MSGDTLLIAFIACVAVAVLLFEWSMLRSVYGAEARQKRHLKQRLDAMRQAAQAAGESTILREGVHVTKGALSGFGSQRLNRWIEQAGANTTSVQLATSSIMLALAAMVIAWLTTRRIELATIVAVAAACIPIARLLKQRAARLALFDEQLSEALDLITRALKAGHTLDSAMSVVAEEMPQPIAEEFAVAFAELSYGVPLRVAFGNLMERVPSKPLKIFVTSVLVQRETGGNLAEILHNISNVIRGGYKFQRKLRTLSAEGRMSGFILAGVPFALTGMLQLSSPRYLEPLFTDPRGHTLLLWAGIAYLVGFVWIKRILKIEV